MFANVQPITGPISYDRRRPDETLLYKVIQGNLSAFLDQVHAKGDKLPSFVTDEFKAFLDCGILAKGFLRMQCKGCHHERLVAFSCKKRGFCPSCGTKRMIETSAWLMDNVIPKVAVRQCVRAQVLARHRPQGHGQNLTNHHQLRLKLHVPEDWLYKLGQASTSMSNTFFSSSLREI